MDGGRYDVDLRSDLTDSQARAGQIENLLLVRRTGRTTDRVSDVAGRRGLAQPRSRRYAGQVRFRNHLSHNEAPTEGEPRQPLFGLILLRRTDFSSRG